MNPGIKPGIDHPDANPVWLAYYHNVLYDVVMAVRGCKEWGPRYTQICDMVNYPTETVVNFLRYAEKLRYITGKFGHYNRNGSGGAKHWFMSDPADYAEKTDLYGILYAGKIPAYPYDWLTMCSEHKADLDEWLKNNAHTIVRRDNGHVVFIGASSKELGTEFKHLWNERFNHWTQSDKIKLLEDGTPGPYLIYDYGVMADPRPVGYDRYLGKWEWVKSFQWDLKRLKYYF